MATANTTANPSGASALTEHFPIVIAGAGPTGLVLASLLARYGVAALVLEKEREVCPEARAVTIDDESLRTIQATGLLPAVINDIVQGYGVHYYSWRNKLFARIEPQSKEYGYQKRNAFRQQLLVQGLAGALKQSGGARILYEHEVVSFKQPGTQSDARVELRVGTPAGERIITADWLVACDGGRSAIREALGISLEGDTYSDRWLIVDMIGRSSSFRHTRTFCDPLRPAIRLPGPQTTLRYEFMLRPGDDLEAALDEKQLRSWIRDRDPADAGLQILRKVVYTFHARVATKWRRGRVLLAGDAAHLTPPFAGQGMNSGVRDALNLAWKLAEVVQGRASASLLDSFELERKPHARALIQMALRIGLYMQPKSKLQAAVAQTLLKLACLIPAARDYILQLKFKPKPRFHDGVFVKESHDGFAIAPGQLMTQPRVELAEGSGDGRQVLLDEVLSTGFAVLRWARCAAQLRMPAQIRHVVEVIRHEDDFVGFPSGGTFVRDCEKEIARVLDSARADAVILRPDRYVFAYLRQSDSQSLAAAEALLDSYFTRS